MCGVVGLDCDTNVSAVAEQCLPSLSLTLSPLMSMLGMSKRLGGDTAGTDVLN